MVIKGIIFSFQNISFFSQIVDPSLDLDIDKAGNWISAINSLAEEIGDSINSVSLGKVWIHALKIPLDEGDGKKLQNAGQIKVETQKSKKNSSQKLPQITSASFSFLSSNFFTMALFADETTPKREVLDFFNNCRLLFFKVFSPLDIINWDGNLMQFLPFKSVVNKLLDKDLINSNQTLQMDIGNRISTIEKDDPNKMVEETNPGFLDFSDNVQRFSPLSHITLGQKNFQLYPFFLLKNFSHLIYALLMNNPIIVSGDILEVQLCTSQLLLFNPYRSLRIEKYDPTHGSNPDFDIFIIDESQAIQFRDVCWVDLKIHKVKNGKSNKYCQKIAKEVEYLNDPYLICLYMKKCVNWLMSKANILRGIIWRPLHDRREILSLRADMEPASEEIMLRLAGGKHIFLQEFVDKLSQHIPIKNLLITNKFVQYSAKKVIVPADLSPDERLHYFAQLKKISDFLLGEGFANSLKKDYFR